MSFFIQIEPTIKTADKTATVNCDVLEDISVLENYILIEGRLPENDHEICLTKKAAKQLGVTTGDIVYIEYGGERADFIVLPIVFLKPFRTLPLKQYLHGLKYYLYIKQ